MAQSARTLDDSLPDPLIRLRQIIDVLEKYRVDIEQALCYTRGAWTFDQVCQGVLNGALDLYDLGTSVAICQLCENPNTNVYHVFVAAGDLQEILRWSEGQLLSEAKLRQCSALSFEGRAGWGKALKNLGWSNEMIVMYKEVI